MARLGDKIDSSANRALRDLEPTEVGRRSCCSRAIRFRAAFSGSDAVHCWPGTLVYPCRVTQRGLRLLVFDSWGFAWSVHNPDQTGAHLIAVQNSALNAT